MCKTETEQIKTIHKGVKKPRHPNYKAILRGCN